MWVMNLSYYFETMFFVSSLPNSSSFSSPTSSVLKKPSLENNGIGS
ncbi:unknown protein [Simkania negevensis Z]|uniref:Uncharacterized protein n=1 Tax=Simkania negevensis (strain ATCC VR-1471 / DSM 27360 / Z) TaxID=331113 RepID=F8L466_SIMNZ|nr:unknown protein [Simkania negevensis Z]